MDPRRLLILARPRLSPGLCLCVGLSGCAGMGRDARLEPMPPPAWVATANASGAAEWAPPISPLIDEQPDTPIPTSPGNQTSAVDYEKTEPVAVRSAGATGRRAITAANLEARSASRADAFVGGVQLFAWSPGRIFEVWTAPLRVTTLTLAAGETLVSKAAGDTVRWQIGETTSGEGAGRRVHVLLKPLQRDLETNLVLTTNRRVYFLALKSGAADGFNAAVAWDTDALDAPTPPTIEDAVQIPASDSAVMPQGPLDAHYRIQPRGRAPRWTPASVFNDGLRTFIVFDADLQIDEAPALFVLTPDGESQMVNYRQAGGLFIVDRVFDRAELRLGDRRPQVVRLERLAWAAR